MNLCEYKNGEKYLGVLFRLRGERGRGPRSFPVGKFDLTKNPKTGAVRFGTEQYQKERGLCMKQKSRRAKGKKLQRIVKDKLLKAFPHLHPVDIRVAKTEENGEDIKLSRIARRLIPYQFEAKSQQKFKTLYSFYDQTCKHGNYEPVLVVK